MTTTNMGLTTVSAGTQEFTWATEINSNLTLIDEHDHSSGNGLQLSTSIINVVDDFEINTYVINVNYLNFYSLTDTLNTKNTFFEKDGDLWYTDIYLRNIQITSGDSIYSSSNTGGGFSGLYVSNSAECVYATTTGQDVYTFLYDADPTHYANILSYALTCTTVTIDSSLYVYTTDTVISADLTDVDFNFPTSTSAGDVGITLADSVYITTELDISFIRGTDKFGSNVVDSLLCRDDSIDFDGTIVRLLIGYNVSGSPTLNYYYYYYVLSGSTYTKLSRQLNIYYSYTNNDRNSGTIATISAQGTGRSQFIYNFPTTQIGQTMMYVGPVPDTSYNSCVQTNTSATISATLNTIYNLNLQNAKIPCYSAQSLVYLDYIIT